MRIGFQLTYIKFTKKKNKCVCLATVKSHFPKISVGSFRTNSLKLDRALLRYLNQTIKLKGDFNDDFDGLNYIRVCVR